MRQATTNGTSATKASSTVANGISATAATINGIPAAGAGTSSRFRQRKLNVKAHLQILRETDIEAAQEDERQDGLVTSLPKVDSGVEQKEEKEHHLQAVIHASHAAAIGGKIAQIYIPTPDAIEAPGIDYSALYPVRFAQPATYIRFSSTVEDCIGPPYCMTADDEVTLKQINTNANKRGSGRPKSPPPSPVQCSEDWFEQLMSFFEALSTERQPFAAVDPETPLIGFDEMRDAFDETVDEGATRFAKELYDDWKSLKVAKGNRSLMPKLKTLKMDTGQDTDDSDPYVCFRRREVRQTRKTRGRDAQIVEKLKKLRRELEEARQLLTWVKDRENKRKEDLRLSKEIFEKREEVRSMKRALNADDDDELLITQKTPKRRAMEPIINQAQRTLLKLGRQDSIQGPELEMRVEFKEKLKERERTIAQIIDRSLMQFEERNRNFIDQTEEYLWGLTSPAEEEDIGSKWISLKPEPIQQPTPPDSVVSESGGEDEASQPGTKDFVQSFRWAKPSEYDSFRDLPRFRQRRGRGGRLLDVRIPFRHKQGIGARALDAAYDRESGEESEEEAPYDPYSSEAFKFREMLRQREIAHLHEAQRRASDARELAMEGG